MRPFKNKVTGILGLSILVTGACAFIGCGVIDFLDEASGRYIVSAELDDGGDNDWEIDVLQENCGSDDEDEYEDFFNTVATLSLTVADDAPGVTLQNISISYTPITSPNGDGVLEDPPDLLSPDDMSISWYIASGETDSEEITVISIDTKEGYRDAVGWVQDSDLEVTTTPALGYAYYTLTITLEFVDDTLLEKTLIIEKQVLLGSFDRC